MMAVACTSCVQPAPIVNRDVPVAPTPVIPRPSHPLPSVPRDAPSTSLGPTKKEQEDTAAEARYQAARTKGPQTLRALDTLGFCRVYGRTLRGQYTEDVGFLEGLEAMVRAEAKRRALRFSDRLVQAGEFRIGDTRCHLYATWGEPDRTNRSVGRWGEHVQHVYRNVYVYTQDGLITGYQD